MAILDNITPNATTSVPSPTVIAALIAGTVKIRRRAEIYEADSKTPYNIPDWNRRLVGGNVTIDRTRDERRMCEISFQNKDNALKLNPLDGFWYDKIVKVFWGIKYFDKAGISKSWETQVGEFMIDRISNERFPHQVDITGRDYAKKCLNSKLKFSIQFPRQTPIEDIIRALAANSGVKKFALPVTGQSYALDIVFERGIERWNVMKQIADSIGYEVYFRGDGYLTMRPYPDPLMSPLAWTFRGGKADGSLINYTRSSNDSRVFNHIVVIGASTTVDGFTTTIFAEALNEEPSSPTRISRLSDRVDFIQNDYFTEQTQAQDFANARLRIGALEEYEVNFSSLIIPWLDAGDIVGVDDSEGSEYVPNRFLLSDFSLPLALGEMSGNAKRVTIVGSTQAKGF